MTQLANIKRYYRVIDNSLFMITGNLDYDRITDAMIALANAVHDFEGDTDDIWCIGEGGSCCLSDLIIGAYRHYAEWHAGQWSKGYAALSSLGQIFNPGMTYPETNNEAYLALESMAD